VQLVTVDVVNYFLSPTVVQLAKLKDVGYQFRVMPKISELVEGVSEEV
jgi:hypothetical protein